MLKLVCDVFTFFQFAMLLHKPSSNMKYATHMDFMERREEQINKCIEEKISCKWIIGSGITNSNKGYVVSFKDNKFAIDEFPAGSESEYGITNKDIYFKTR